MWRQPALGVCGNEVTDELSSDVTEPQNYGSPCVYKGGVPDKLCLFPADESYVYM